MPSFADGVLGVGSDIFKEVAVSRFADIQQYTSDGEVEGLLMTKPKTQQPLREEESTNTRWMSHVVSVMPAAQSRCK